MKYSLKVLNVVLAISFLATFVMLPDVFASHTVSSSPPGGIYNSPQLITLESTEAAATIYYTTDGTDPTNSSTQYDGNFLEIDTNTTLRFMAVDLSDNHTSTTVTEIYTIFPAISSTEPGNGTTGVSGRTVINVTFSEPMDESTISTDTFKITFNNGENSIFGTVSYNSTTDTATFVPEVPFEGPALAANTEYVVILTTDIRDASGNALPQEYSWSFTTSFTLGIIINDVFDSESRLSGSTFTITPNPLTLDGSLDVADNGEFDDEPAIGRIEIGNVQIGTYIIAESVVPENYTKMYDNLIYTVHETNPGGIKRFANRDPSISIQDLPPVSVPAPHLTDQQLQLYEGEATIGIFDGIQGDELSAPAPIFSVEQLDAGLPAILVTSTILEEADLSGLSSLVFDSTAPAGSDGQDIFNTFDVPIYPAAEDDISSQLVYVAPAIVIPYEDSKDNFILTPIIAKVHPGQTLFMAQPSFVESKVAKFEKLNMTFAVEGNNVGFSFGISDRRPPGTTKPPLDAQALFLDVGVVGDVDFSDPDAFESPPRIDILVNKTLPRFAELPDGCSNFVMLLFDEGDKKWSTLQKLRNPTLDSGADTPEDPTDDRCGFTLEPPHFSTFAVGGIKGGTIVTESVLPHAGSGGGGRAGSSSTSIDQMVSGENVVVETEVGTETVISRFEYVEPGSGQLKIESGPVTNFEDLFDDITEALRESQRQGIVQLDGVKYTTVGTVFDLDSSKVQFTGSIEITIPYKEELLPQSFGPEANVRLLHYNTDQKQWQDDTIAIDQVGNTVTGRINSTSPLVAAILMPDDNPSKKFKIVEISIFEPNMHVRRSQVTMNEAATVSATLENIMLSSNNGKDFVFIVQTLDENGVATGINVQRGSIEMSKTIEIQSSWSESKIGVYTLKLFVWSDLENPEALSDAAATEIKVIQ